MRPGAAPRGTADPRAAGGVLPHHQQVDKKQNVQSGLGKATLLSRAPLAPGPRWLGKP